MGKIVRQGVEYGGSSNSADCIKYNETKSVKEAIDEIKASSSSNPTAASVTFNNTDTGLAATNVQDAVTELNGKLLKVAFVSREVTVGTNNNATYGGYYGQSPVPTLSDAGVSGTLLDVIVAYYSNENDYNITCDVKYLKNSPHFAVSSVLASQTILVVFALLYY